MGGQVLGAVGEPELVGLDQRLHRPQCGERRDDGDLDVLEVLVRQRERDLLHQRDALEVVEVHLPVAGDQWFAGHALCLQNCQAGELFALEELQGRATAGRDVGETGFVDAENAHRGGGVAAADHRERR